MFLFYIILNWYLLFSIAIYYIQERKWKYSARIWETYYKGAKEMDKKQEKNSDVGYFIIEYHAKNNQWEKLSSHQKNNGTCKIHEEPRKANPENCQNYKWRLLR